MGDNVLGKDKDASKAADYVAQEQTRMAHHLFKQSDPTRNLLFQDAESFLMGGRDVTSLPEWRSAMSVADQQYKNAENSILGATPEGGGLTAALANLENERAATLTNVAGMLSGAETDRALQLGTGGAAQGAGAMANAGMLQGQRAMAESQSNAGKSQGTGQAVGTAVGLAMKASDRRLKSNIRKVGTLGAYNLYAYDIFGCRDIGVMADEVPEEFTLTGPDGYLMVDYGALMRSIK